jgi:hypothetical protein
LSTYFSTSETQSHELTKTKARCQELEKELKMEKKRATELQALHVRTMHEKEGIIEEKEQLKREKEKLEIGKMAMRAWLTETEKVQSTIKELGETQ